MKNRLNQALVHLVRAFKFHLQPTNVARVEFLFVVNDGIGSD